VEDRRLRGRAAGGGRRRRRLVVAAAVIALAVVAAVVLALAGGSGGASGSRPSTKTTGTGTIERRTLAEHLTATGTIGYAGESTVLARLSGTVTALPSVGEVVRRGQPIYALAGEPVLLMYGAVPAYRSLAEGVTEGEDVEQLERNLAALGYEPGPVDEDFTAQTAAAVRAWQEDLGLEVTGEVELGRVAFLRGPQRVTRVETLLGAALGGGSSGTEEDEAEPPSVPVLRTSSTRRIVSVDLEANQQSIAHRGQKVGVILPDGAEVPGVVRRLAAVESSAAEAEPGEEAEAGVEATIAVTGRHRIPALEGAAVNVLFTQRVRRGVLSVPLTALIAIGGERFAVHAVGPGPARGQIVVTPGLAADGYVEVAGKGLRAGMSVETGR
jgi:peptidoglycan hydrolase-like protein with peptidoglycan-binding domain